MPRTYFPRATITVTASPPHPEGTEYLVSIGDEKWEGKVFAHVVKIQMVFAGRIEGRKAPSYPVGTDDFDRVALAVRQISGEDAAPKSKPSHALLRGAGYYAALADTTERRKTDTAGKKATDTTKRKMPNTDQRKEQE